MTATTQFDCAFNGVLPPINVTVDFGDGSGTYVWTREDRQDVWSHIYSEPGLYTVSVSGVFRHLKKS
jgi:PKD repeat protein